MRDFLTALLQCSASMSLVTLVYAATLPLLSKRYSAKWRYMVWLAIAAGWIFPFRPRIGLSFLPAQMPDIPVQPIINAIPLMAEAGDIVNAPETIPLWLMLAVIWIIGVVSVVSYHALRHGRFMKMVRRWSDPVTDLESLGILNSLKSELGIKTQVGLSVCQSSFLWREKRHEKSYFFNHGHKTEKGWRCNPLFGAGGDYNDRGYADRGSQRKRTGHPEQ